MSQPPDKSIALRALEGRATIDLFAGCGGLSLGLHLAGWQGLFAVEKDPMAYETLHRNLVADRGSYPAFRKWPDWLEQRPMAIEQLLVGQYREHLKELRGRVALLAGGPPCQGFSIGGRRNGADVRNTLVNEMLEVVDLTKPAFVLIENVEGFARRFVSNPGDFKASAADQVVARLADLGYAAHYGAVDASEFGVPQVRRRVLLLGIANELSSSANCETLFDAMHAVRRKHLQDNGLRQRGLITASEAIDDLDGQRRITCPDSPRFEAGTYATATSRFGRLMRRGIANTVPPDSHRFTKHGERILALYKKAHATQPPGRLSKQFLLDSGTKKDKKYLLDPHAPASTITTHPDEFIHHREPRNVTVREMARLQSFPDDFQFYGRYTINGPRRRFDVARCSQVGNAVPPLLAEAVGRALDRIATCIESASAASDEN